LKINETTHFYLILDDRQTTIELEPTDVKKVRKCIPYILTTKTANKRGAGTDSNVFIQIYGADGKTEEIPLDNRTDNFERGKEDVFKIEADDVGPIYKVRIGHDGAGMNSGWMLESLMLKRHDKLSKRSVRSSREMASPDVEEVFFLVNRWFDKGEDDGQIVRELVPTDKNGRPLVTLEGKFYFIVFYFIEFLGSENIFCFFSKRNSL